MTKHILLLFTFIANTHISPLLFAKVEKQSFSNNAWNSIAPIFKSIVNHPFNVQLANGTLRLETFEFYKKQDSYYLISFSKALAILASKLNDPSDIKLILNFSKESLDEDIENTYSFILDITPANFAYTHFLRNTAAHGQNGEIAAALLPCFWIYAELANILRSKTQLKDGPYFKWITSYNSVNYKKSVDKMINLTNRLYNQASPIERKKMLDVFTIASKLEFKFWDDAFYNRIF